MDNAQLASEQRSLKASGTAYASDALELPVL
jgi:hypothetical protein